MTENKRVRLACLVTAGVFLFLLKSLKITKNYTPYNKITSSELEVIHCFLQTVSLFEFIDTSACIDKLLLTGKVRMAL